MNSVEGIGRREKIHCQGKKKKEKEKKEKKRKKEMVEVEAGEDQEYLIRGKCIVYVLKMKFKRE